MYVNPKLLIYLTPYSTICFGSHEFVFHVLAVLKTQSHIILMGILN